MSPKPTNQPKTTKAEPSDQEEKTFEDKTLEVRSISRTVAGGRRMRFRTLVIAGNRQGRVGFGTGKGKDVTSAVAKAAHTAHKNFIQVDLKAWGDTIPFTIKTSFGNEKVLLKPGRPGSSFIANAIIRSIAELVGLKDLVAKSHGPGNPLNVVKATFNALQELMNWTRIKSKVIEGQKPSQKEEKNETPSTVS